MNASVWSPNNGLVPEANVGGLVKEEVQTATANQRTFELQTFAYAPNTGSLVVYKNRQRLYRNKDFIEATATRIILTEAASVKDVFIFVGFVGISGTVGTDPTLRADLLGAYGSNIIGHDSETVSSVLNSLQLTDYTALRNYAGQRNSIVVTGYLVATVPSKIGGQFVRDDTDVTSLDNGGTILVDTSGRRWKRVYSGAVKAGWFGAIGDWNGISGTDNTAKLRALFSASTLIDLEAGIYRVTDTLFATADHQIIGRGLSNTQIIATQNAGALVIPAIPLDKQVSLHLEGFTVVAKNALNIGGTRDSHGGDGAMIGGYIRIGVKGSYGAGLGDLAYNTNKVRDSGNVLVASNISNDVSGQKTFFDVSAYGVGIYLCKCIGTQIDFPQIYGSGVGIALIGCDLTKIKGGRTHEVGMFHYEERVGSWGSQTDSEGMEYLHNRRAGGIVAVDTKFSRFTAGYYEAYTDSALMFMVSGTEGFEINSVRIDDPYYTGGGGTASQTTPLGIFFFPRWNNRIVNNKYQKFTAFTVPTPKVRVISAVTNVDSNHPEAVVLINPNGYAPLKFASPQPGCRYGEMKPHTFNAHNIPDKFDGNVTPLAVQDGNKWVIFNAAAIFPTPYFNIDSTDANKTLIVTGKTVAGATIFFSVDHKRADGTLKVNLFSATVGGFNNATYTTQTQALAALTDIEQGDQIAVTWQANTAYIPGISLK